MAGPNLELFKFGVYLFFPLAVMLRYGDPAWYNEHVLPIRDQFWPKQDSLYKPPRTSEGVRDALEEMKQKRIAKREARLAEESGARTPTSPVSPPAAASAQDSNVAQMVQDKRSERLV